MQYQQLNCKIRGVAPLIQHNGQLADPLNDISKSLKKVSGKRSKTDADFAEMARLEWYGSLYLQDGKPCIPGEMVEAMLISAAKKSKKGEAAKAGVICESNFPLIYDGPKDPNELWGNSQYKLTVGVRVQRNRVMRTRPIFRQWEADIEVLYLDSLLNQSEVDEFLNIAGSIIGLGDWRPKFGRFEVI